MAPYTVCGTTTMVANSRVPRNFASTTMCESLDVDDFALATMSMCRWIKNDLAIAAMLVIARKLDTTDCTMMQRSFPNWKLLLTIATMHLIVRSDDAAAFTSLGTIGAVSVCRFIPTLVTVTTMLLCWKHRNIVTLGTALETVLSIDRIKVGMTESAMDHAFDCCLKTCCTNCCNGCNSRSDSRNICLGSSCLWSNGLWGR